MSRCYPWTIAPIATVVATLALSQSVAAAPADVAGIWEGKLNVGPGLALTLSFHVTSSDGKLTTTLSVPEQAAKDVPVAKTDAAVGADKKTTVTFDLPPLRAKFSGTLSDDKTKITGTFTQAGQSFPLTLEHKTTATAFQRPQEPKPPFPYKSVEVTYENPDAPGVKLAGTLTLPEGTGPFPCALLITGSGQQDRNETLLGHKPFLVIADYLTRRGVAVLRVDDRGVGKSTGGATLDRATSADFATDVQAGLTFLKTRSEIDPKRIGLIGHSEGGLIAPIVATKRPDDVAFIVLLAGTGVPGDKLLTEQAALVAGALGAPAEQVDKSRAINEHLYAVARAETDPETRRKKLDAVIDEEVAKLPEGVRTAAKANLTKSIAPLSTEWFHFFFAFDPAPTLSKVQCPVLALNGSKDLQVPPRQNLPAIEAALKAGGNKDYTVKELPGLNHLFQTAKTGGPQEYATIQETFSPDALKIMGDWVAAHVGVK